MKTATAKSDVILLLTAAIWGFAFVAQRIGMDHVGPFTYNGVRFALGSLTLAPLLLAARPPAGPIAAPMASRRFIFGGGALGAVLFVAASLQQMALLYTTAGKAGFITGLYVVIVPILGLFWSQRPSAGTWAGALLCAAGLYLLSVTADFQMASGDLLVLVSAVFWSFQVLLVAWLSPRTRPVELAFYQFSVCSLLSLIAAAWFETVAWASIYAASMPILYGGVLSVGVAYTLQVVAQRDAHPAHASILMSLEAVFAAWGGWLLLDETLSLRGWTGCALMLAGMLLSQLWALRK
ncbi:MAG TPA: DMT family transporter [Desulfobacterales bacterium]|jgi:drug/metabolite transporter (DMT)-like permease|nr:DMT family transporter [Desulfobacterales bacterium]HSM89411.1 DMT family transporter [Desulfobacterales bacterium]